VCLKDEMCQLNEGAYRNNWEVNPNRWPEFHGTIILEN
jgi:hypothetical protein